ncbi:MAG TPA: peptide ABC transporter substrate-binding protein [Gemmatimonadaceae bacterium]|nr:peptide ABC transporter substrate-binding protein [Gemmatimonadaceae bacterium]
MRVARAASTSRAIVGVLVAGALACAPPDRPAGTVVYASGADLESANPLVTIHPLSRQVQRYMLFVTLARYDSALAPVPYFAREWAWSDGGRSLTFILHEHLRWHDGTPTTAHDVAFTIAAARDPATGYPRYGDLSGITDVRAVDDTIVRIEFAAPPPQFPAVLCELPILPEHLLGSVDRSTMRQAPFNLNPVGNGPFRFVERIPGQRWVFARNDSFPPELGGPPRLERVVVAIVDEATTKFAGLVSGELDVAGIAPSMAGLVERDSSLRLLTYPVLFANALIFNAHQPPLDDVRVRRAIDAAIDRQRIIDAALAGFAIPARGAASPDNPLGVTNPPATAATADSLLDRAGWPRGADGWRVRNNEPLRLTLLTVGSGDNAIEQLVQADLRARGIRLDIRQLEFGAFLTEARADPRRYDLLLTGIPGDLGLSYLGAMFDSRLAGGALDYTGFHTPMLDSAFARVRESRSTTELRLAWESVQNELHREVPVSWIYHSKGVQGISSRLQGVTMDLRGEMVSIADWYVNGSGTPASDASIARSPGR